MQADHTFDLGDLCFTQGVILKIAQNRQLADEVLHCIKRHANCDWGEVDEEDWAQNDDAVENGERILSAYTIDDTKIWIITEWDRSYTAVLLPDEYQFNFGG